MNDALHNKVVKWFYDHEELLIAIMNKTPYQSDGWDYEIEVVKEFLTQTEQEPVVWMYQDKSTHEVRFQKHMRGFVDHGATYETPLYTTPPQLEERNFCPRCGKRNKDIHTCTPPQE